MCLGFLNIFVLWPHGEESVYLMLDAEANIMESWNTCAQPFTVSVDLCSTPKMLPLGAAFREHVFLLNFSWTYLSRSAVAGFGLHGWGISPYGPEGGSRSSFPGCHCRDERERELAISMSAHWLGGGQ